NAVPPAVQAASNPRWTAVVGRGGEEVRPELRTQVAQKAGSGKGGRYRVAPLIPPPVHLKTVTSGCGGHELPDSHRGSAGVRVRLETALDKRQVVQVLRQSMFTQGGANHRLVHR